MDEGKIYSFKDLTVWKECRKLRIDISNLAGNLPRIERYRLIDQMIRASRSVTANIAEGYGRHHHRENMQFCRQAHGSLYELIDHITCLYDEGYIEKEKQELLEKDINNCIRILNGYIRYLNSLVNKTHDPGVTYYTDEEPQ